MTIISVLIGCLIISVTLLLRAEFAGKSKQIFIFKPLSTLLIIVVILLSFMLNEIGTSYKAVILAGMLFCLGGDIALMFDSAKAFLTGLVLFLIGHLAYAVAILYYGGYVWVGSPETPVIVVISLLLYLYLFPGLKKMKIPTLFYVIVITVMVNVAVLTLNSVAFTISQARYIAVGAILFYISDVILAINKFKIPFRLNRISLAFYFAGQLLIALSTHHTDLL